MDLTKFAVTLNIVDMQLTDPTTGAGLVDEKTKEPITIGLVSTETPDIMKLQQKTSVQRLNRRLKVGGKFKFHESDLEEQGLDVLVAATKRSKHIVVDGQPVDMSDKIKAREVYFRFPWIRQQVDEFVNDRSNWMGES